MNLLQRLNDFLIDRIRFYPNEWSGLRERSIRERNLCFLNHKKHFVVTGYSSNGDTTYNCTKCHCEEKPMCKDCDKYLDWINTNYGFKVWRGTSNSNKINKLDKVPYYIMDESTRTPPPVCQGCSRLKAPEEVNNIYD